MTGLDPSATGANNRDGVLGTLIIQRNAAGYARMERLVHVSVKNQINARKHRPPHHSFGVECHAVQSSADRLLAIGDRQKMMVHHKDAKWPRGRRFVPPVLLGHVLQLLVSNESVTLKMVGRLL